MEKKILGLCKDQLKAGESSSLPVSSRARLYDLFVDVSVFLIKRWRQQRWAIYILLSAYKSDH